MYLGYELPKGDVRKSNWLEPLNKEQVDCETQYQVQLIPDAASDAYASLQLFLQLMRNAYGSDNHVEPQKLVTHVGKK